MRIVPLTAMLLGLMLVSGCSHPDRVGDGPVAPARAALPPLPERWRAVADAAHAEIAALRLGQLGGFERSVSGCERGISKR